MSLIKCANQVSRLPVPNEAFRYEGGSFRIDLEFKKKTFGAITHTLMAQSSLASLILIDPLNLPSLNSE